VARMDPGVFRLDTTSCVRERKIMRLEKACQASSMQVLILFIFKKLQLFLQCQPGLFGNILQ
jgi:hypothetical protein